MLMIIQIINIFIGIQIYTKCGISAVLIVKILVDEKYKRSKMKTPTYIELVGVFGIYCSVL